MAKGICGSLRAPRAAGSARLARWPGVLDPPARIALHGTDPYFAMSTGIGHIRNRR